MSTDDLFPLLQRLSLAHGISGHEGAVADVVREAVAPFCDEVRTDPLGNVLAFKKGEQPGTTDRVRLLIAAHMDEIGFVVSGLHKDGFLHVTRVGGVDRAMLLAKEVWVHTATGPLPGLLTSRPPHLTPQHERTKLPPWHEILIDVGLSGEEARAQVRVGDMVTMRGRFETLSGSRVAGKAMDDRASVVAMVHMLERLMRLRHDVDVYAVATVQEEIGLRGAMTSTYGVAPHVGIAIDVSFARQPGVPATESTPMGEGAVIAQGGNIHRGVHALLLRCAASAQIPHHKEVMPGSTGTDAWAIQVTRTGVPTGLISIPLASMHSMVETLDLDDVRAAGRLLAEFAANLDPDEVRGWQHVVV